MLRFNNFTDEYKYFVQGYVLPLMGMSGKPAKFYDADDVKGEIGSSIVVGVVDTGKNKKLYLVLCHEFYFMRRLVMAFRKIR